MKKSDIMLLERIFEKEISGTLPLQSKSKKYEQLADAELVEYVAVCLPGWPPVTVKGWVLTDFGRYEYCLNAPQSKAGNYN